MTKLILAFSILFTLSGCAGQVVDSAPAPVDTATPAPNSCDLLDETPTLRVFAFSYADAQAPGCKPLGGGVFECPADYCLATTEAGTCPHCFGGGE